MGEELSKQTQHPTKKNFHNKKPSIDHEGEQSRKRTHMKYREREITPDVAFYLPEHAKNTRLLKCVIVGGGQRGQTYATYAEDFPHLMKIVAIVDPRVHVRKLFSRKHSIPDDMQFADWSQIASRDKIADFVCICTPDKWHKDPAIAFARKKYHVLLEKPMATTKEDCIAIAQECEKNGVMLAVCHVLRYYPPNKKIKELIDCGKIGDVVSIQHLEPVGYWHFAHSYVRGNWRNTEESSFSLLAKSCHDVDLIIYWMSGQKPGNDTNHEQCHCTSVSSFGSLNHFTKQNKPPGAGTLCLECDVEKTCPYSAVKIYLNPTARTGSWRWPATVVTDVEDLAVLTDRLRNGPYGRCVYDCDNDVCDNQVVNFQFSGGQTASFSMVAFTESICARTTRVFGTKGELTYNGGHQVKHYDFLTKSTQIYDCSAGLADMTHMKAHGGADFFLMDAFVKAVMFGDRSYIQTGSQESLKSHLLVFAAEESRLLAKTLKVSQDGSWS